ncbi:MAG: DEAD/DEAH box helicase family protein [Rectinemataceae bacterium]
MPTDTSEKGLESIIVASLIDEGGYIAGTGRDYEREYGLDTAKLESFIGATQPEAYTALGLGTQSPRRTRFLQRLQGELAKRGVIDVLRKGIQDEAVDLTLYYPTPSPKNKAAVARFAVDDRDVRMCTQLRGRDSWFLPFNKGWNSGAGNEPNPSGIATDYLWKDILRRETLADIIENFAQLVEKKDEKTGKKKREEIFPRYHQLDVVHRLLAAATKDGAGTRYLIQHSAGSGKSNSISWLAHQLIGLEDRNTSKALFDSIVVVTDRRILDKQIRDNIRQFAQVGSLVGAVTEGSAQLKIFIEEGKKIIITTIQKFPHRPRLHERLGDDLARLCRLLSFNHPEQGDRSQ